MVTGVIDALEPMAGEALNRDIKLLVGLFGETLVRHEAEPLLELVERVRVLSRSTRSPSSDPTATAAELDALHQRTYASMISRYAVQVPNRIVCSCDTWMERRRSR